VLAFPPSWPNWSSWALFGSLLAGLDLALGYIAAMVVKTRGTSNLLWWSIIGVITAVILFWVLASSLTQRNLLEINVLWITVLLTLIPAVNAIQTGRPPGIRVVIGVIGMTVFAAVVQWPEGNVPVSPGTPRH
jgi:hypothetical protein